MTRLPLEARFPAADWQVLDHYDAAIMTEASIQRARTLFPPTEGTIPARYDEWPLPDHAVDVVFGLLSIHEFRKVGERRLWFGEARRVLSQGGRVVIAEHVRDGANFLAFGPGFVHFHSVAAWAASWESAGMKLVDHFKITPFVRVFVLVAP